MLVERVAGGDTAAFAELYDRHGRRTYLQARALCATAEQAEDVTQEAFLSLWRLARGFDARRGGFTTWMGAIVRNRVTDAWRRAAARPAEVGLSRRAGAGARRRPRRRPARARAGRRCASCWPRCPVSSATRSSWRTSRTSPPSRSPRASARRSAR